MARRMPLISLNMQNKTDSKRYHPLPNAPRDRYRWASLSIEWEYAVVVDNEDKETEEMTEKRMTENENIRIIKHHSPSWNHQRTRRPQSEFCIQLSDSTIRQAVDASTTSTILLREHLNDKIRGISGAGKLDYIVQTLENHLVLEILGNILLERNINGLAVIGRIDDMWSIRTVG